jgi:hypothetical protein
MGGHPLDQGLIEIGHGHQLGFFKVSVYPGVVTPHCPYSDNDCAHYFLLVDLR